MASHLSCVTLLYNLVVLCPSVTAHSNRSQHQRTEALAGFKSGRYQVLVATDIAARGIDVEALSHVVNFDVPNMPDNYIHRVGRTARAQLTGDAFTFVSADEEQDLRAIERALGKRLPRLELEGFNYDVKKAGKTDTLRSRPTNGSRKTTRYNHSKLVKTRIRIPTKRVSPTWPILEFPKTKPAGTGYGRRPRAASRMT